VQLDALDLAQQEESDDDNAYDDYEDGFI
jgi:hypothetical protein